ncbi:MAG TPA: prolyl oligopeptidase family serine peptidase [Pyrinomonadaceae bacterium]|nr:prolyl oligopeptidase family serine peptidase [Pyrinomonadaceae bacterium]
MKRIRFLYALPLVLCAPIFVTAQNPQIADNKEAKKVEVGGVVKSRMLEAGPQLVIQNVPGIPLELVEAVKKYTESKPVGGGAWHPTKREMLVGKRSGNVGQVHLLAAPLGELKQLTSFPDPVGGGSWQPTTGNYFLFFKATGGNEISQLYRYDSEGGNITRLTTNDKMRIGGGPWTTAGDRYLYTSVPTGGGTTSETIKTEFYTIDPMDANSAKLLVSLDGVGWGASDWSPDDKKLLMGKYVSANESYIYIYDVATGEKTLLTPQEGTDKVAYSGAEFSKDGKGIYLTTDKGSEFQRLMYMDLATKQMKPLTGNIDWDVSDFSISDDGKLLAFTTNENGFSKLHILETASGKETKLPKMPAGQISGFSWHKKTNELRFNVTSYTSISDVYSMDLKSGKITHWAKTELNGFDTTGLREPELIKWKSFDGKMISGFVYKPPTKFAGKRPVIINIHGGPEGQATPGPQGRGSYYINDLGIAVIYPNVRGSSGFGKTFLALDNGYNREDSVKDIGALIDWIGTQPDLDKDRIMITGGSYGGYMTLAVATNYNDKIRASLDVVGISNFNTFLKNTETYRRDLRRVEYGDERDPKMAEFLQKISPLTNAHKITKPLFVVQGKNDPRVPYTEAEQIVAAARANNTPVWFLMANDEGHGFSKKNNSDYLYYSTILFIKDHLLN